MIDWKSNEGRTRRQRDNRRAWIIVGVSWVVIIAATALGVGMVMG